jgi:hypothetical protein
MATRLESPSMSNPSPDSHPSNSGKDFESTESALTLDASIDVPTGTPVPNNVSIDPTLPYGTGWRLSLIDEVGVSIYALVEDKKGGIWIATGDIWYFDGDKFSHGPQTSLNDSVSTLYVDSNNVLWIGGGLLGNRVQGTTGVVSYDGSNLREFLAYSDDPNKVDKAIPLTTNYAIFEIASGGILVADAYSGVSDYFAIYNGNEFELLASEVADEHMDFVRPFFADTAGNLWLNGDGRLYRWNGSTFDQFTEANGWLSGLAVSAMAEDDKGKIWMAGFIPYTDGWALFQVVENEIRLVELPEIVERIHAPTKLYVDHSGGLWLLFSTSVYRLDSRSVLKLSSEDGLPQNVEHIVEDSMGRIWFGSLSGLVQFHPDTGEEYKAFATNTPVVPVPTAILPQDLAFAKQELMKNLPYYGKSFSISYRELTDSFFITVVPPLDKNKEAALTYLGTFGFNHPTDSLTVEFFVPFAY